MQVSKRSLQDIFKRDVTYVVPLFQRPYVWEREKNWEPLWESLSGVADAVLEHRSRQHFLGAAVLEQVETLTGEMPQRQIIDGQQRFTTLQLFLFAFQTVCKGISGADRHVEEISSYLKNTGLKAGKRESDPFKVWPTNSDRDAYKAVLNEEPIEGSRMADAVEYFKIAIRIWIDDCANDGHTAMQAVESLFAAVDERLFLAILDLEKDDDSLEIFETLNALGTPLLASDLIKNYSLRIASKFALDTESLYESYFKDFEMHKKFWSQDVTIGRFKRKKIDVFYQYFLGLKLKADIVHEELFRKFKEFLESEIEGGSNPGQQLVEALKEIREYADLYQELENLPGDHPSRRFLDLMENLETTTFMPVVLYAHHSGADLKTISRLESSIESYLMRRLVIRVTSKGYNRLVTELLSKVQGNGQGVEIIPQLLSSGQSESTRWPSNEEIEKAFLELPLYKILRRSRMRVILEYIDAQMDSPKMAPVRIDGKLQIEHLMPQSWFNHWELPPDSEPTKAELERNMLINTIGNLTLISGSLNSSISNGPWSHKRIEILKYNSINMNREFHDPKYEDWDEGAIKARSRRLAKLFCKAFPRMEG